MMVGSAKVAELLCTVPSCAKQKVGGTIVGFANAVRTQMTGLIRGKSLLFDESLLCSACRFIRSFS